MPLTETAPDALARTYAKSLYDLATSLGGRDRVEEVLGELEEILDLARGDARFSEFLASRALAAAQRAPALERIFAGRVSDVTRRFLLVLNEKGRLGHLVGITAALDSLVQQAFGRVEVDVITAESLPAHELAAVRDRLAAALSKDVILHPSTEPAMIGGVKFRIGDQLIDGSFATRLRQVKDRLAAEGSASMRARLGKILDA
jgi:F-type H+-transporting ATPase subunit delta